MRFRHLLSVLAFLFVLPCAAAESPKAEIEQVVERFQASLKAHDRAALSALFLTESKAWWTVLGDASYEKMKAKSPNAPRYKAGTWQEFADFVGSAKGSIEERFHNVRIETDGSVASVYFDFEFVADGKIGNRGAETWQLIRTNDGWKIASMLYSTNF